MVAILRYLTLAVIIHTLLVLKLGRILIDEELRYILESLLARFRKVAKLLIVSLKKLYEMMNQLPFCFKINYPLQYLSIQSKSW